MGVVTFARSDLDLFSDAVMVDPYPHFAELRERASVVYMETLDAWAITRYEPIRAALADPSRFSSKRVAFSDAMNAAIAKTTLATDPPAHTPLRAVLTRNLSPRALRPLKERIDAIADEMVAELVGRGTGFDGMGDLARQVPLRVVVDLIGVKGDVRNNLLSWGEAAMDCLGPMNARAERAFGIAGAFFGWVGQLTADDLEEGSVGHGIFMAAERGEIPQEACGEIIHQYIAAGMDTTIGAIGHAVMLLGQNPEQFERVRRDRSLVPSAFAEVLRCESPVQAWGRHLNEDTEIDGTLIPAGAQIAILFGAGNRDPRHYEDPDSYLAERNPIDHLSFGYGTHTCAGQGLARLEAHATIDALARRVKSFAVGEPVRRITNMTRTLDTLPVIDIVPA